MEKKEEQRLALKTSLRGEIDAQLAHLTTKIPAYSELNDEGREKVDKYIAQIDLSNAETIDKLGSDETQKISEGLDKLIGTLATHDVSIDEMFADLMMSLNQDGGKGEENFVESFKKSPFKALRQLANKPKKQLEHERYRRAQVLTNMSAIEEKLEVIRNELKMNSGKLEAMAQNSVREYAEIQFQIIALQETLRRLKEQGIQEQGLLEKTFIQIDQGLQRTGIEKRIARKIDNYQGISVNAATQAIMARLLAVHNEELAADYEQDLTSLLPELKGIVVMASANDSLIQAADTHKQFIGKMNQMLIEESNRSKEAIEKVQSISSGSVIDVETARTLTGNVVSAVRTLKQAQTEARPINDAFLEILADFKKELISELGNEDKTIPEEQAER